MSNLFSLFYSYKKKTANLWDEKTMAFIWRPALVVEEAGIPGENHHPWASNW
jgi:hypothetical protein